VRSSTSSSIELVPPSRVDTLEALRLLAAEGPRDIFVEVFARILAHLGSGRASWFPEVEIARLRAFGKLSELRVFAVDPSVPPIVLMLDVPLEDLALHLVGNPRVARHVLAERSEGGIVLVPTQASMGLSSIASQSRSRHEAATEETITDQRAPTRPAPPRAELLALMNEPSAL
jgi:hypothetical protein